MMESGIDETRAMAIVGHKTLSMIQRYRIVADRHTVAAGKILAVYHEKLRARKDSPEVVH